MPISKKRIKTRSKPAARTQPLAVPAPETSPFATRDQLAEIDGTTVSEVEEKLDRMMRAGLATPVAVYDVLTGEFLDVRFHLKPSMADYEPQHAAWFRCCFPCPCITARHPRRRHTPCEAAKAPGRTVALLQLPNGWLKPICGFCLDLQGALVATPAKV